MQSLRPAGGEGTLESRVLRATEAAAQALAPDRGEANTSEAATIASYEVEGLGKMLSRAARDVGGSAGFIPDLGGPRR
jgi:hypothetical protein